jgi:hypothetical protein
MPQYRTIPPPHALSQALHEFLASDPGLDFAALIKRFSSVWRTVLMGGMIRDLYLNQVAKIRVRPADADLVIFGASSIAEIGAKLDNLHPLKNTFGGIKIQPRRDGVVFDIWRVEDHTNMPASVKSPTIEQLLRHNLLDIDAILWDPVTDTLHDCGSTEAIRVRKIGLMGPEGISQKFLARQVAHVLVVAFKTGFEVSGDLRAFVRDASAQSSPTEVQKVIQRKLPHAAAQIETLWNDLLSGGIQAWPANTRTVSH